MKYALEEAHMCGGQKLMTGQNTTPAAAAAAVAARAGWRRYPWPRGISTPGQDQERLCAVGRRTCSLLTRTVCLDEGPHG